MKAAVCLLLAGCALGLGACTRDLIRVEIPREEMQQRIESSFPVRRQVVVTEILLEDPEIVLQTGGDRIGLRLRISVSTLGQPFFQGQSHLDGTLRYDRDAHAFFVDRIRTLSVDVPGLPPILLPTVEAVVQVVGGEIFRTQPIYTLREGGADVALRVLLRSVSIEEGRVIAVLGPPG